MPESRTVPTGFYWSPSRHSLALSCPWCFVRKYVLCQPVPKDDNDAFRYGGTLHSAMEGVNVDQMMEEILDRDGMSRVVMMKKHLKQYHETAKKLSYTEHDRNEHEFVVNLVHPDTNAPFPVPFYGIADRLLKYDKDRPRGFVEYKTSANPWSQRQIDENTQFTWYWLAFVQSLGCPPLDVFLVNFVKDQKEPRVLIRRIQRDREKCSALFDQALDLYQRLVIGSDTVPQVCTRSFFCPFPS